MTKRSFLLPVLGFTILLIGFAGGFYFDQLGTDLKGNEIKRRDKGRKPQGFWFPRKESKNVAPSTEQLENLAALGYVDGVNVATVKEGVVIHDQTLINPGLNLYTSGHGPEGILMDSTGRVLHKWRMDFNQAFPTRSGGMKALGAKYWRRMHLFPNGDVLAIYDGLGLIKVDKNSNLIWAYSGHAHHDLDVRPDGTIYVLTRTARVLDHINSGKPILEDSVTILSPDGKEIRSVSILKALLNSPYSAAFDGRTILPNGDIFHTNTIEILDGRHNSVAPFLKKGNALLSLCYLDTVAILDLEQETIVWALSNLWSKQHQPTMLENGRLLVFDNAGRPGKSRVLEIDPLSQRIDWMYEAREFYSEILGTSQRLENGNTLITDSDDGRVFEVTSDRKIVWEFFNPSRAGSNKEFVAVIPEMTRLVPDFPTDWLK